MSITILTAFCTALATLASAPDSDRLYGRVLTVEGQSFEGFVRWDRNEATGLDFLDGRKVVPLEYLQEAASLDPEVAARQREERTIVAFGMRISWDEDDQADPFATASAIRMSRIRSLERVDRRTVRLTLKDGGDVELLAASSDIGRGMRGLEIERVDGSPVTLDWHEIERLDFFDGPPAGARSEAQRLHGTVTTWNDHDFVGAVTWDLDESVGTDVLDGRSGSEDYEIAFEDIAEIAWESDRSALVTMKDGVQLELRGTNDVNRENRGIEIAGTFGRAIVEWEDFQRVRFHEEYRQAPTISGSAHLQGTVRAIDGRQITGRVRWDNDEEFAWEVLDGWFADSDLDVEFGAIASIEKRSEREVEVTMWDGTRFTLEDRNDVDERNNGIFVQPEGRSRRLVRWVDFERVDFVRPEGGR
ncbi:MAG: hypothetical protein AAF389_08800 [Gemmatimonadota bacterium]